MKRIILLTTTLLASAIISFAQTSKIDSLKSILKTEREDTNKVNDLLLLGQEYNNINHKDTVIILIREAINLSEKINWQSAIGNLYFQLGHLYYLKGDYFNALIGLAKSLNAYELRAKEDSGNQLLESKRSKSVILGAIGEIHWNQGDYPEALNFYYSAMKIAEEVGDNRSKADNFVRIANVYNIQGDYPRALENFSKALDLYKEVGSKRGVTLTLSNASGLYKNQGDYRRALDYDFKALKYAEEAGDKYGISIISGNIGLIYTEEARFVKISVAERDSLLNSALNYCFKALKIAEEIGYKEGVAVHLDNIGNIYDKQKEYTKALDYRFRALKIGEELNSKDHIATNLGNIGSTYTDTKNYTEAEKYLLQALAIFDSIGQLKSKMVYENFIIELYTKSGDYNKALSYSYQSYQSSHSFLLNNLSSLSENEKSTLVGTVADNSDNFFSPAYLLKKANDSSFQWLYNFQLFQRGIVLESSSGLAASVQQDTSLKPLWKKFSNYKNSVGVEYLKPIDERRKDLAALEDSASNLEKELLAKSLTYRNWKERINITWQDVQKHLAKDEAAVEFVSFNLQREEKTDSILYAAMVLTAKMQYPKLVFLFEEKQLSRLLQNIAADNTSGISNLYTAMRGIKVVSSSSGTGASQHGDSLYSLIWQPLMPYLKDIKTIAYVPDGLLNKISMAAIPTPDGRPMIEKYRLRQMASTRSVAFPAEEPKTQPAAFFGGIDYTYTLPSDTTIQKDTIYTSLIELASRGNRGGEFNYLEGTKEEAEGLSNLYKNKNYSYQLVEGKNATEKTFKQMEGKSPAVLHIATHGYFFPSPEKNEKHTVTGESNYSLAEDPLLRSGLVLAGGNYAWKNGSNPYEEEDGILTAYEIAHLNLSTTDMVVLSACETGLGDIKGAEGVYGLQRAFKMAGVKYIVMSLWQVPDKETQEFMQTFYTSWLNGEKIRYAFQETQREMAVKYEPYKWAAFVLVE